MGFGKHKDKNLEDLVHKIELFDLETGDPAIANGKRQFFIVRGSKSLAYKNAIERDEGQRKRKGDADFSIDENINRLARRMSEMVVSAYIDISETDEPDIVEFANIDELPEVDRENFKTQLRYLFAEVTDLTVVVNAEVVKNANFLPNKAQTLSDLLNNKSGTEQPQKEESKAA